jgi:multicomponent Na+:H+ antiporter subunit D
VNWLLVLPLLIPLASATVSIPLWRWPALQKGLNVAGSVALLAVAVWLLESVRREGIQVTQLGAWPAPFGITLVADLFSAIMVLVASITALAVSVYSLAAIDPNRTRFGYFPLLSFMMMGVCGAFLTGDLFNLYVWFEVLLISSFVLMALGGERHQMEGAIKYVTLNLISSVLFLSAVGILYGMAGTLNMADLAVKLHAAEQPGLVTAVAMLFLAAFGIKAAVFPLFFWLPASYHTPPVAVSAIFAGLLTKVGVYALLRVFTLIFVQDVAYTHLLLLVIAALTMLTGVLGAVAQNEFRRILSFHIISQIGYMILGLGLFTPLGLAGAIFYIFHHIIVKTNLFLVSGIVYRLRGTYELKELGGVYRAHPALAVLFLVPALSLAGMPPLSGFFAKLSLVQAGLAVGEYLVVGVALLVGALTLFSMTKIWGEVFWKEPYAAPPEPVRALDLTAATGPVAVAANPGGQESSGGVAGSRGAGIHPLMLIPVVGLAVLTVLSGLAAGPIFSVAMAAGGQLLDPTEYINAVLGE